MKSPSIVLFAALALMLTGIPAVSGSLCSSYATIASAVSGDASAGPDRVRGGDRRQMMGPGGKCAAPRMGRHGNPECQRGQRFRAPRGQRNAGIAAMKILRHAEELELTEQQTSQLEELAMNARKQMVDLHAAIEKEKLGLEEQMRSESDDITTIMRHLNSLAEKRVDVQELKLRNWIAVKKILTDDQKEKIQNKHPRMCGILD